MKLNKKVMFITALTLTLGAGVAALNNRNDANVVEAAVGAGKYIYFARPLNSGDTNWANTYQDNNIYAHVHADGKSWKSSSELMTWVANDDNYVYYRYQMTANVASTGVNFASSGEVNDWENISTRDVQTANQTVPTDAKNCFYGQYVLSGGYTTGSWGEFKQYSLTIDYNGGSLDGVESRKIAINANGTSVTINDVPSRDGYAFKGWATTANATETNVALTHTLNKNATYYAVWEENSTAVTYKFVLGDQTINVPGTRDVLPEVPEFEGYQIVDSLEDMTYDEETTTYTINNYFQKVETKSSLRLSYTCEGQEPNVQDGFTRYYCETSKKNVNAYIWNSVSGVTMSTWPGTQLNKLVDNIYYIDVPLNTYDSIIFNDGSSQTANLVLPTTDNCCVLTSFSDLSWKTYSEITFTSVNNVGLRFGFAGVAKDFLHVNELETALKLKLSYVGTTGVNEKVVTINEEDIATVDGTYQYGYVLPMVASQYSTLAEDANVYNTEFTAQLIVEVDGVEYPMNEKTFSVASLADYYIANAASLGISSSKVEMINLLKTTYCA